MNLRQQHTIGKASLTPLCDALERQRKAFEQTRTAAYGDALTLAKGLERKIGAMQAELDRLNLELGNPIDHERRGRHQKPAVTPRDNCLSGA